MLLAGDFNLPNVKWHSDGTVCVYGAKNNTGELFVDLLSDLALTQFVTQPTFINADCTSKNTLDYIVSDNSRRVANQKVEPQLGSARQAHVVLALDFLVASKPKMRFLSDSYNFAKGNYDRMRLELEKIDWNKELCDKK